MSGTRHFIETSLRLTVTLAALLVAHGSAEAQSCSDPDFPVSCPGSDLCWAPETVCSTLRVCDGDDYACTSPSFRVDCSTGGDCVRDDRASGLCTNTCRFADDGECDDGGPGSLYDLCDYGTDCADCGSRSSRGGGCSASGAPPVSGGFLLVFLLVAGARRARRREG